MSTGTVPGRNPEPRRLGALSLILAGLLFVALAIVSTWPLAVHLNERSLASPTANDVRFNLWVIYWGAHALVTDPVNLHHANIFHPEPWTFAYSDIELSHSLLMMPVIFLSGNPELVYSLLVLASLAIGGFGFFLLGRRLTGSAVAGIAGALVFLYNPSHFGRYSQIQFFTDHWLPWFLWSLLILLDRHAAEARKGTLVWAGASAAFFCLHALSGSHNAVYGTLLGIALAGFRLVRDRLWRSGRFWRDGILASLCAVLVLAPVFFPYVIVEKKLAEGRVDSSYALIAGSANPLELLSAGSPFYRWLDRVSGWPSALFDGQPRGFLFVGFVPILLAIAGLFTRTPENISPAPLSMRRSSAVLLDSALIAIVWLVVVSLFSGSSVLISPFGRIVLPSFAISGSFALVLGSLRLALFRDQPHALALFVGWVTRRFAVRGDQWLWIGILIFSIWASLGPEAWLYNGLSGLPLVKLIRVPRRFMLVASVALAVLAVFGAAALARRVARPTLRAAVAVLLLAVFTLEASFVPLELYERPSTPDVYHWLGTQEGDFAIIEFPAHPRGWAQHIRQVYGSIRHWKRLIVGYSGYQSPENIALLDRLNRTFPDDVCLDELERLDVRFVLVFPERIEPAQKAALATQDRLIPVRTYDGLVVYRISAR